MSQANSYHDLEFLSKSKYPQKAYINLVKTQADSYHVFIYLNRGIVKYTDFNFEI